MMYGNGGYENWGPMMQYGGEGWWFGHLPLLAAIFAPILIVLVLWSVVWKGLALWHAGRRGQPWWFVIMLVVNTLGILEIVYLFGVAKLKFSELFSYKEHGHHH
jgi:hypothetical protein